MPLVPLPPLKTPPASNPRDYAIVVGINDYLHDIPVLAGCINDARMFCDWLVEPTMGGLDPANIRLFTSNTPGDQQPFRDQIVDFLDDFNNLAQTGTFNGRRLYLFFAGHGITLPPPDDKQGCALVMANARLNLLRGLFGVTAAESMRLANVFREVMLVMDCCAEVSGAAELQYKHHWPLDPTLPPRAFIHIQAARANASTAEVQLPNPLLPQGPGNPPVWQGVLTNAVLLGLTAAPADGTGIITAGSLKTFLEAQKLGAATIDVEPQPGPGLPPPPLMTFGTARGLPVDVAASDPAVGTDAAVGFQVKEGIDFTVVVPPRALPATVSLAPGQYQFEGLDNTNFPISKQAVAVRQGGERVSV